MAISFFDSPKVFPSKKNLKIALKQTALLSDFIIGSLNYIFVSDDALLEINKEHLEHDFYTDIITFDLSEEEKLIEGDIYISTDRVEENGAKIGVGIQEEYLRVVAHGILHLIGFQDKTKTQSEEMTQAENEFIQRFHQILS